MGKIRQLPPDLANQIAAGEVVERPASVVKELVENAVDAGATRISIFVEMGGKKLIRVEDDGEGMDPADARLALERHATSKIARAEDLEAIRTMGFRGEALPSIASVSHFVLRSRRREAEGGTEIRVNGGVVASVTEIGMAPGTVVEAADLFYNLPARRKFLKSDVAETTQVSRMATQLALAYPGIGFTLMSGPRQLLRCTPPAALEARFYQLYGERPDLVAVAKDGRDEVTLPGGGGEVPNVPVTTALLQNHPNPFNPTTMIPYEVAAAGHVEIAVYDVTGSLVRTVVRAEKPVGRYTATWDGRDNTGNQVHTGVYFYRMTAPGYTSQAKKMLLLK